MFELNINKGSAYLLSDCLYIADVFADIQF